MSTFTGLVVTNILACQGVQTVYGRLPASELASCSDVQAIDEQESAQFTYSRVDRDGAARAITAQMKPGRVVTFQFSDGSFDEWRINITLDGRGKSGVISVTCDALWLDCVNRADSAAGRGWVSQLVTGTRGYEFALTQRTATSIWDTFIIPNLPSWMVRGTITPTAVLPSLPVSRLTPGALALAVRDALRAVDVTCEVRLRRNGTTNYMLDLVTQVGASAAVPVFHPSLSLLTLDRKTDPTLQATRVLVKGASAPDGLAGKWGRARMRAGAPSGNVIALTDRNGGANPVAFDGQFVGMYLLRVLTGRTFLITASAAAAGTVTLGGGVSTIAADEDVEIRLTEPNTNTRRVVIRTALIAGPLAITNIAGLVFTVADNWDGTVPVSINGQYLDWSLRRASLVATPTPSNMTAGGVLTVSSVAGIQAGDLVICGFTAPNYFYASGCAGVLVVDTVNVGPVTLSCHSRDGVVITGSGLSAGFRARVYRPVATTHLITNSASAGNTITVDAVGTAATTDLVEIVQLCGTGEVLDVVDHPTYIQADPTGYGVKCAEITKTIPIGVTQLMSNAWMRTWTNAANPPDGWTRTAGTTTSQNTNVAFTQYGGLSWRFQGANTIVSPRFDHAWRPGDAALSVIVRLYPSVFASNAGTGDPFLTVSVKPRNVDGTLGTALGAVTVYPSDALATNVTKLSAGAFASIAVNGINPSLAQTSYGFAVEILTSLGPDNDPVDIYIDTVEVYGFSTTPAADLAFEFGDAIALLQAGNNYERTNAAPPVYYQFGVADLERALPTEFDRLALTVGGNVRAADIEYGIDVTVRLLKRMRDLLNNTKTTLTLSTSPTLLSKVLGTQSTAVAIAIAQAQTSAVTVSAPAFLNVPSGSSATLPAGTTVTVPSGSGSVNVTPNTAVTVQPATPSTPVVVVTSGAPKTVHVTPF